MNQPNPDTNSKNMGGIGGIIGAGISLGILAATTDIMLSTIKKQKELANNPYKNKTGYTGVQPIMRKTLPGIYREFPNAGKNYSTNMNTRINKLIRR